MASSRGGLNELSLALLIALIWGATFPVVRVSSDVGTVLFWRFLLSTPLMGILYLTLRGFPLVNIPSIIYGVIGGFLNFLFVYFMFKALTVAPSYYVSAIFYVNPLLTLAIGVLLGLEAPSVRGALGVLLGFSGVVLINVSSLNFESFHHVGLVYALLSAILFSLLSITSRFSNTNVETYTLLQLLVASIVAVAVLGLKPIVGLKPWDYIAVAHQGLGAGLIALILWFKLLNKSISLASTLVYMVPLVSYLTALPIAGELPGLPDIVGLALILAGIYLAIGGRRRGSTY